MYVVLPSYRLSCAGGNHEATSHEMLSWTCSQELDSIQGRRCGKWASPPDGYPLAPQPRVISLGKRAGQASGPWPSTHLREVTSPL